MFKKKEKYEVMDFVKIDIMCDTMRTLIEMTDLLNDEDRSKMVHFNLESMKQNIDWLQKHNLELKERLK